MNKFIKNLILKLLLKDYRIIEKQIKPSEARASLVEFANNEGLQKYINIAIGNLIRKHLYVTNMYEKSNLSGQVMALRKLQETAIMAKKNFDKEHVEKKEESD